MRKGPVMQNTATICSGQENRPHQVECGDEQPNYNQQPEAAVFHHADGNEFPIHISLVC
ncbi:MAG TPA: hypothetical protein VFZ59_22560 [Verrucomicrobiae bacterium]|nr:hypothetical protein [Verrucomicrobiae bacterium]